MTFEDYVTDLDHNERVQIARDYAAVGNPELAGWKVLSQAPGPAQLATSPDGRSFQITLAPGPHAPSETGTLLEAIAFVSGIASRLNQLLEREARQAAG